jgi:hypothetical protein
MIFPLVSLALLALPSSLAAPQLETRGGVSPVSASTIAALKPYTQFALAAYCPNNIAQWKCGASCNANPGFIPYANGGNDGTSPYWFVGYNPSSKEVVVAHAGTDPLNLQSLLVDANFFWDSLSPSLFPGISQSIQIHDGFTNAQAISAPAILAAVKKIIQERGVTKVTVVGHSLGGAIANLDAIYLKLQIPSISVKIITYGQPRVGNQAFADYMDANFPDLTRVTNQRDLIPIVPGRFLGFHHSHGEIHRKDNTWSACAGQDNTDPACTTGYVENIFVGNILDHLGPYEGVYLGNIFC